MSSWKERQSTKSYCKAISKLAINIFRSLVFSLVLFHIPWSFKSILDHEIQPTNRSLHRSYVIQIFVRTKHVAVTRNRVPTEFQATQEPLQNVHTLRVTRVRMQSKSVDRTTIVREKRDREFIPKFRNVQKSRLQARKREFTDIVIGIAALESRRNGAGSQAALLNSVLYVYSPLR